MLSYNQVKTKLNYTEDDIKKKLSSLLRVDYSEIKDLTILRRSIDARHKDNIQFVFSVAFSVKDELKVLKKNSKDLNLSKYKKTVYEFPKVNAPKNFLRPIIIGAGPAGLFCGLYLAKAGFNPIILERGKDVESRQSDIDEFHRTGKLNPESNIQFGEGGAGTFSDGKLNTLVKDKDGKNAEVLRTFVRFGADKEILYDAKPHIGTDVLSGIIKKIRNEIISLGGEVRFNARVTDFIIKDNKISYVIVNDKDEIATDKIVLAIGHSSRDTFYKLFDKGIEMNAKSFAVGFRVEHPQRIINKSQYGVEEIKELGACAYKVTSASSSNRGVYSFCMCPGGYVVNASSEDGMLAVNGMSFHDRAGENANSAIIISVTPDDFPSNSPLSGIEFQRNLERKAFLLCNGKIPVEKYGDFKLKVCKTEALDDSFPEIKPNCRGDFSYGDLTQILPKELNESFVEGMECFGNMIKGFNCKNALLSGIESRTSSPVRINRDEKFLSNIKGIYPCGEGAGYAGGIMSAAMDGIRIAEAIALSFESK